MKTRLLLIPLILLAGTLAATAQAGPPRPGHAAGPGVQFNLHPPRPGHQRRAHRVTSQERFARHYAQTAVRQYRQSQRMGCGFGGRRWSNDYYDHYDFTFRAPVSQVRQEIAIRDRMLAECRARNRHYRYGYR